MDLDVPLIVFRLIIYESYTEGNKIKTLHTVKRQKHNRTNCSSNKKKVAKFIVLQI